MLSLSFSVSVCVSVSLKLHSLVLYLFVPMATTQKLITFSLLLDHHHPKLSFPPFLSKPHNHKLSSKFSPVAFNASRALYTHSSTSHKLSTPITVSRPSSSFLQMGPHEACSSREITVKSSVSESDGTSTLSQTVLFSQILLLCLVLLFNLCFQPNDSIHSTDHLILQFIEDGIILILEKLSLRSCTMKKCGLETCYQMGIASLKYSLALFE